MISSISGTVSRYYADRLASHGATPRGVDWNGAESQELRFRQFLRLPGLRDAESLIDLGCGYGALLRFLRAAGFRGSYLGVDLAAEMVASATAAHAADRSARFVVGGAPPETAEFVVASGIFNVRVDVPDADWHAHMREVIARMAARSRSGLAYNCLTTYSDPPLRRPHLYYGDPAHWFDHAKREIAPNVALLHDYGLYEFTLLIDKRAPPGAARKAP